MNAAGSLASDLAIALDPVLLARAAGIEPDEWQARVLRSVGARMLLNCCRQSGKSTITSVLAVHTALYLPASLILLLSPGLRQSSELFKKCLQVYRALGRPVPAESETALTLTLENGSRIVALPGQEGTIRGYSGVRLIIADEAARILDTLYYSVRPMLGVSGGRLVLMSTPFGKRGAFHHEWTEGVGGNATKCRPNSAHAYQSSSWRKSGAPWPHSSLSRNIGASSGRPPISYSVTRMCWPA